MMGKRFYIKNPRNEKEDSYLDIDDIPKISYKTVVRDGVSYTIKWSKTDNDDEVVLMLSGHRRNTDWYRVKMPARTLAALLGDSAFYDIPVENNNRIQGIIDEAIKGYERGISND